MSFAGVQVPGRWLCHTHSSYMEFRRFNEPKPAISGTPNPSDNCQLKKNGPSEQNSLSETVLNSRNAFKAFTYRLS